jgi:hypothetical protein
LAAAASRDAKANLKPAISFLGDVEKAFWKYTAHDGTLDASHYSSHFQKMISEMNPGGCTFEQMIVAVHFQNQSGMLNETGQALMSRNPVSSQNDSFGTNAFSSDTQTYTYPVAPNYLKLVKEHMINVLKKDSTTLCSADSNSRAYPGRGQYSGKGDYKSE